jgi:dipeptidyl aminopeptidase/acylaminoacyl peptidase
VLAPNYRGSAGAPPTKAGYDSADEMVSDIEAGARFLTETASVDGRRIGIVGFSFGGYLSLLTAAQSGRTFAAVVDFFGPTDLAELYQEAATYRAVLAKRLGGTPDDHLEQYRRFSPLSQADKIASPVLILHGAADQTVRIEQSIRMADALKAAGKDVTFLRLSSGHGFSVEENLKAFPEAARFLDAKLRSGK